MKKWLPFTHEGRQTLVYLIFAGAGPALTVLTIWAMYEALQRGWQSIFGNLSYVVASCLLIIVTGLAMFVSIRAVKLGKDGFSAEGGNAPQAAQTVADAAQETADDIKDASS